MGARIEQQLSLFSNGINQLLKQRLSPMLVPEEALVAALQQVDADLKDQDPTFSVANVHPAYYYSSATVYYTTRSDSIYVILEIPVTASEAKFDLFQIRQFPVPFNHTTNHVTAEEELPAYLAVGKDGKTFVEVSPVKYAACSSGAIKQCPVVDSACSTDNPTCALVLFKNQAVSDQCSFRVIEEGFKSNMVEIDLIVREKKQKNDDERT
jgi:hypothetical protein